MEKEKKERERERRRRKGNVTKHWFGTNGLETRCLEKSQDTLLSFEHDKFYDADTHTDHCVNHVPRVCGV